MSSIYVKNLCGWAMELNPMVQMHNIGDSRELQDDIPITFAFVVKFGQLVIN
jgi:hypothetical protein